MQFDINNLLNYDIEKTKEIGDNLLISQLLKERRINLSLTLKESSDGICSLSYLSKIEQRKIKPKKNVVDDLVKKYNIVDDEIYFKTDKYNQILEKSIKDYLNTNVLLNYYNVVFKENNYKANLIKFAYYVSNSKLDKAYEIYKKLSEVYTLFNLKEFVYFSYFLADLLYKDNKNLLSYKLLDRIKYYIVLDELSILIDKLYIKTTFKIHRDNDIRSTITHFKEELAFYNLYDYIKEFDFISLRYSMFKNDNKTNFKNIKSRLGINKYEKAILESFCFYREKDYEKALKTFSIVKNFDDTTFLYYAALHDLTGDSKRAIEFLKNHTSNLNTLSSDLLNFLIFKKDLPPKDFFNYLIKHYFKNKEVENYYYLEYIINSSILYFSNLKYYKDIYLLYKEFEKFKIYLLYS